MTPENGTDLRFPIGDFQISNFPSRSDNIRHIGELPTHLASAVKELTDEQLDTYYRPGGWTIRQTVHHVADSHMNSMIRFKLALTEDQPPTIRPYFEEKWAELDDSKLPVGISLQIIDGVHKRWTRLLESMTESDFSRQFIHPATGTWTLEKALALYAWHSLHHTAHITAAAKRYGWY